MENDAFFLAFTAKTRLFAVKIIHRRGLFLYKISSVFNLWVLILKKIC